ncbi:MAG TPA: LuxR C-terminal-related transcriptional regulator [Muribaculum sp.]|jgi:DNA-binding CsgD family transcriptional regulator|uniref:LuxR C-terminal-related transcriptional regulator n=1 Tax=Heminiphilus faecis TaxID=2601703 RepID=A0ABV4CY44_9BACT|nr:LuxR C-terminal-related transcriptional regulator [Heminiphilus faecis]RLT76641.1 helix-turn-helix transcriptional regulator [bacterium J10(2018)]HRF67624.1 LuxR C-terminal-related transcriptional regulator [Muribaculum sp.]
MNIALQLDDTLQAIGLRYLFLNYFDIDIDIISETAPEATDTPSTLYIVSPTSYCRNIDFYAMRRARTIVTGDGKGMLHINRCESDILEQLRELINVRRVQETAQSAELTQREVDVLRLVAMGLINKEIADKLNISFNTVLSHRKNITSKLGIRSVSGLSVYAMMNGYINEADLNL